MKQVVIIAPEGEANLSSIAGSYEILNGANRYWKSIGKRPALDIVIAGTTKELKLDSGFFSVHPVGLETISQVDLVIIPSIRFSDNLTSDNSFLIEWIRQQYAAGAEIATICSGAFLLAATGLLEGKKCSTHWNLADKFRKQFPGIELQTDRLITGDKGIYTNGGAFSFLNLILLLVEKYFDRETAIYCSKIYQIDMDRTTQSPFYIFQTQKNHGDEIVYRAQAFIEENLSTRISFERLATELSISRRNFDRRFIRATGNSPVEYLQRVKVEVAKTALERGRKNVSEIMEQVGYSDDKAFREIFKRLTGMSPIEYRAKYN